MIYIMARDVEFATLRTWHCNLQPLYLPAASSADGSFQSFTLIAERVHGHNNHRITGDVRRPPRKGGAAQLTGAARRGRGIASSSFHVAEITYAPDKTDLAALEEALDRAGYLEPLPIVIESDVPATEANSNQVYFRHSATFEQTGKTVSFGQEVAAQRPLWPCPGMGPIRTMAD